MLSKHKIHNIKGRMVFDSRGIPTIEAEVKLNNGIIEKAIAPSGASKGKNEALEKRDNLKKYFGLSVDKNIKDINSLVNNSLVGELIFDQRKIDNILINLAGNQNKSIIGANTTIAVSMACLKAAAKSEKKSLWQYLNNEKKNLLLPIPQVQIFGGGAHAANYLPIQDFLIIPNGAKNFYQAMEWVFKIYRCAYEELNSKNLLRGVADEGGYWPSFNKADDVLQFLTKIIEKSGFRLLKDVSIALDVAGNNFRNKLGYNLYKNKFSSAEELLDILLYWLNKFPIISIEDPFSEEDKTYFKILKKSAPRYLQVVGDDLVVTNKKLIKKAFDMDSINSVLIKPNQIGTISETYEAFNCSKSLGLINIISARSGETEDVTISDLSVGWQSNQIKVGSFSRSERLAKWNQCLRIGEELNNSYLMHTNSFLKWNKL
ncbi:MAG: phosphopyruvate hydratase [Pseudomonadota bacterium]|nr:phosphopyruvate hydratase [Pseudomonadota bacterium]